MVARKTTKVTEPREAAQIASRLIKSHWGECGGGQAQLSGQVKGSNSGLRLGSATRGQECLFYKASVSRSCRTPDAWCLALSFAAPAGHEVSLYIFLHPRSHFNPRSQNVGCRRRIRHCMRTLSVCSPLKFCLLIYFCTFEEWKRPFPPGLCKDMKD